MEQNSGVNTVLIVIVLLVVVGALVWFVTSRGTGQPADDTNDSMQIDVTLPEGGDENPEAGQ